MKRMITFCVFVVCLVACGVPPQRLAFVGVGSATTAVNDIADDYQKGLLTKAQVTAIGPTVDKVHAAQDAVDGALMAGTDTSAFSTALTNAVIDLLNQRSKAQAATAATRPTTKP